MTLLPVVERELRVAARKRSTFWIRIAAALVALLIAGGVLVLTMVIPGFGRVGLGKELFAVLTWLSLGAALSAGLFFTSDCLSEEKREGTIGFLFLTDLRGHDVVFGKLLATSLRCFYALLAVLPILAITLLLGGVTGAQFWKTSLALVNAMFISLAAGMFVSALSRDSQKALAGTVLLMILLVAGGLAGDAIGAAISGGFNPQFSLSSPGYVFAIADSWGNSRFWPGLLVNQAISWLLLGLTCALLPRSWQEKGKTSSGEGKLGRWWKFGGVKRRARLRQKFMEVNPVLWLACRERWQAVALWVMAGLTAGGVAWICVTDEQSGWWFAWNYLSGFLTLLLYLGITSQAGRFLVDAQRSGLIEMLLATPLTGRRIVEGQWRAMLRMFGPALTLFLAAYFVGAFNQQRVWSGLTSAASSATMAASTNSANATSPPAPVTSTITTSGTARAGTKTTTVTVTTSPRSAIPRISLRDVSGLNLLLVLAVSVGGTVTVAANLAALIWFGMLMGLTSKSANLATLKTMVLVQVIPWFVVSFASYLSLALLAFSGITTAAATAGPRIMMFFPVLLSGVTTLLSLAKDIAFCLWTRKKLYSEFRERALRAVTPIRPPLPPPPLPGLRGPPVIASSA